MSGSSISTALLVFGLMAPQAGALADSLFPKQVTVAGQSFEKLGEYRYVYGFLFDLYDAALFVPQNSSADDVLQAASPFHLRFRYLRKIEKEIILKSADRMLEKNLSAGERDQIAERVAAINEAYTTVKRGDTSSLTYQPDSGTTLRINGDPKLTVDGRDFAKLYFRIWLGPQPISGGLKKNLLGPD